MQDEKQQFLHKLGKENILVVGALGKTGRAVSSYLISKNISFSISDTSNTSEIEKYKRNINEAELIKNIFSGKETAQLRNINRIILSPGVPRESTLIKEAIKRNITITGEIELAAKLSPTNNIIGITGTDGKSTTASIVYEFIKRYSDKKIVKLGGNIGTPFISFVDELKENSIVILELSSYMLEGNSIPLAISCILNVDNDHLDRYQSFNHYLTAKKNIFAKQNKDNYAVLNADDPNFDTLKEKIQPKLITFSRVNNNANCFLEKDYIVYNNKKICSTQNIPLKGLHNIENILAASSIALLAGNSAENINDVLKYFKGIEHRCEYLGQINGINFINDSKATTTQAVYKAILSQDNNIILIMGGQNKKLSFKSLKNIAKEKVKALILYGEAKEEINKAIKHHNTHIHKDLTKAFEKAILLAKAKDTILLSPACTSFDQFKSYKERGRYFKKLMEKYKNSLIKE